MEGTQKAAAGLALWAAGAACGQVLYDNGPLLTAPSVCTGVPAGTASELQPPDISIGFNMLAPAGYRLADDFTIAAPAGWQITGVVVYGYQTLAPSTSPTIDFLNLKIWRGRPGDTGSTLVYGDDSTNRLSGATFANIYRVTQTGVGCGTVRPVFALRCDISGLTLPPGTYWVDWQAEGDGSFSGPWVPPVTIAGMTGKPGANARMFDPVTAEDWIDLSDSGTAVIQDLPFQVLGTEVGSSCYANCDHSTTAPILNVADFVCFLNRFSLGDPYANCDGSTMPPVLNIADFSCFLNAFSAGCS